MVKRRMAQWEQTGEHGGGAYFWCPDGFVVREPGVGFMTKVIIGLHDDEDVLTDLFKPLAENRLR
ncbi:hypothetical protein [Nocardia sp. NPDC057030]|uniref:hypothetical protein n=1 Tax=unclassified Nocardia TaxID=2637762 RepID=UPI003642534A